MHTLWEQHFIAPLLKFRITVPFFFTQILPKWCPEVDNLDLKIDGFKRRVSTRLSRNAGLVLEILIFAIDYKLQQNLFILRKIEWIRNFGTQKRIRKIDQQPPRLLGWSWISCMSKRKFTGSKEPNFFSSKKETSTRDSSIKCLLHARKIIDWSN